MPQLHLHQKLWSPAALPIRPQLDRRTWTSAGIPFSAKAAYFKHVVFQSAHQASSSQLTAFRFNPPSPGLCCCLISAVVASSEQHCLAWVRVEVPYGRGAALDPSNRSDSAWKENNAAVALASEAVVAGSPADEAAAGPADFNLRKHPGCC